MRAEVALSLSVVLVIVCSLPNVTHLCLHACMEGFPVGTTESVVSEIDSLFIPLRHFSRSGFQFDFATVAGKTKGLEVRRCDQGDVRLC